MHRAVDGNGLPAEDGEEEGVFPCHGAAGDVHDDGLHHIHLVLDAGARIGLCAIAVHRIRYHIHHCPCDIRDVLREPGAAVTSG